MMREMQLQIVKSEQELLESLTPHFYPRTYVFKKIEGRYFILRPHDGTDERWIPVVDPKRIYSVVDITSLEDQLADIKDKTKPFMLYFVQLDTPIEDLCGVPEDQIQNINISFKSLLFWIHPELGKSLEERKAEESALIESRMN